MRQMRDMILFFTFMMKLYVKFRTVTVRLDIVRGGATVILAMGDGRKAAAAMNEQLKANAGN